MRYVGIALVGLLVFAAPGESQARKSDAPVATVGGKEIPRAKLRSEVRKVQRRFKRRGRKLDTNTLNRLKTNVVRSQIEEELLEQRFKKEGLKYSEKDIAAVLKEVRGGFRHDKGYKAWLKATGQNDQDLRDYAKKRLRFDMLADKLVKKKRPNLEDAKAAYKADPDKYMVPPRVNARQIFIDIPREATEPEREEILRRATGIVTKARAQPNKFGELAKRYSEGPMAKKGGRLGDVRMGRMHASFDAAVFNAHEGDVVGPVETPFGVHIVLIEKKHPPQKKTVEDIGTSILKELQASYVKETRQDLYRRLFEEGDVKILEPGVSLDAASFASPTGGRHRH